MKLRHALLALSSALIVTGLVASGCGSTETTPTPADSGASDVTSDTPARDVVADVPRDIGPSCQKDADFTTLPIPDASLGDGGANSGTCVACVRNNCQSQANACAADCECNNAVLGFFDCIGQGRPLTQCGAVLLTLPSGSQALGQALGLCVAGNCTSECGIPNLDGGFDAQRDAVSDAPGDGG
jgi:hypothetical protein